jgi:hypothetical protein
VASQWQHDRGAAFAWLIVGDQATEAAASGDLVLAHALHWSVEAGVWARTRRPFEAARGAETGANEVELRRQRGGGRYLIYRLHLGSLTAVRSAVGGPDLAR